MERREFIAKTAAAVAGAALLPAALQAAPEMASAAPQVAGTMPFWRLATMAVEPAHTVVAAGGCPTWTALNLVCEVLEAKQNPAAIVVVHPDMLKQMNEAEHMGIRTFMEGEMQKMEMRGRIHQEIKHELGPDGEIDWTKHKFGPVITAPDRKWQLIVDEGAQKDTILLLAEFGKFTKPNPEFPGDSGVVMFDERGMAKVKVTKEHA